MSAEDVANAFINHYYTTFASGPAALAPLYQPQSMLTWEGVKCQGPEQIVSKFTSFGTIAHNIPALAKDVQLGVNENSLIIFVSGQLSIQGNPPLNFAQVFQLVATGPGQYYVHNEIFRVSVA